MAVEHLSRGLDIPVKQFARNWFIGTLITLLSPGIYIARTLLYTVSLNNAQLQAQPVHVDEDVVQVV